MQLIGFCRPGYESELTEEFKARGMPASAKQYDALAIAELSENRERALHQIKLADYIFARDLFVSSGAVTGLNEEDRASPIVNALGMQMVELGLELLYKSIVVTHPDSDEGKQLSKFCGKFTKVLENKLKKNNFKKVFTRKDIPTIYVVFTSYDTVFAGVSFPDMQSAWPGGVAHLRMPLNAPSRSVLKLDEALLYFLDDVEREEMLKPGMSAIDLGASPGGWTYYFIHHEIYVTAVDKGKLDDLIAKSDYVVHRKTDAFRFKTETKVDWLVCDVVDNPYRISDLIGTWMKNNLFQFGVINLKLPMGKKLPTVIDCLKRLSDAGKDKDIFKAKHLYHDRDEVTVFIERDQGRWS